MDSEQTTSVSVFHGCKERSKTEELAKLLLPQQWERVERLRSMKRAERAAGEATAGQEETQGGAIEEADGDHHREAQQSQVLDQPAECEEARVR